MRGTSTRQHGAATSKTAIFRLRENFKSYKKKLLLKSCDTMFQWKWMRTIFRPKPFRLSFIAWATFMYKIRLGPQFSIWFVSWAIYSSKNRDGFFFLGGWIFVLKLILWKYRTPSSSPGSTKQMNLVKLPNRPPRTDTR